MHGDGHAGLSLLLTSPIVAIFVILELYVITFIFISLVIVWTRSPDVDMTIRSYEPISFRKYHPRYWHYVPIVQTAISTMKIAGRYIDRVPTTYNKKSVDHRGITHTLWFSISMGLFGAFIMALFITGVIICELYYDLPIYSQLAQLFTPNPGYLVPIGFMCGFFGVAFHCVGDVLTPTGIHYLTPKNNYGYSFDQFNADNKVANRSALPLGFCFVGYGIFFGLSYGHTPLPQLALGFAGIFVTIIPLWLIFVRTSIGEWFYTIYDFIRRFI